MLIYFYPLCDVEVNDNTDVNDDNDDDTNADRNAWDKEETMTKGDVLITDSD